MQGGPETRPIVSSAVCVPALADNNRQAEDVLRFTRGTSWHMHICSAKRDATGVFFLLATLTEVEKRLPYRTKLQ